MDDTPAADSGSTSWFKALRSPDALELLRHHPFSLILLFVIAFRARRTSGFNADGLLPGQALIGDYEAYGLTEQNYRTAKKILALHNFATFQPTTKGTIATLIDTRVFDINAETGNDQSNGRPTDAQRTGNGQPTTNKNVKKEKKENNVRLSTFKGLSADLRGFKEMLQSAEAVSLFDACTELFEKDVMKQYGGSWRNRSRDEPEKLRRILTIVISDMMEGKRIGCIGAYANDLWSPEHMNRRAWKKAPDLEQLYDDIKFANSAGDKDRAEKLRAQIQELEQGKSIDPFTGLPRLKT